MTASPALDNLLRLAAGVVPGLNGVVTSRAGVTPPCSCESARGVVHLRPAPRDGNRAALEALLAHWSDAYPEAGRAYWSLRCWGILIWQPIYLSVIGVHETGRVLSLARFEQPLESGWTREVRLHDHEPARAKPAELIELAAREIAACCEQIFDELSHVIRVNAHAAGGMQADCVLAALLALHAVRPDWGHAQVEALGARWLAALELDGRGGFFAYTRSDGSRALALDRQTCCYHYRRRDGELCSTCPRLRECERIARLNAERDAKVSA
ncbi:siderophore ferric iron reductase [Paraburkholderia susongensis]|uniref:Siderophore ferric iron reductase, AHA_1954 family n=1 Tax=Paraburkholderia susongensis TaxID=1515439 RepID=A0A1X7M376_9BURK|nr:siderophore ferric iron reductase [Paraburkholderia susongensis]SMG59952.1 siderophore ferric iron reductase, AHA_1954 family [Paraburkholderia susongensis]